MESHTENGTRIADATQHPFPYTKLQPPQHSAYIVARAQLEQHLVDAVQAHRLTLVAAPTGSGKTVLVSSLTQPSQNRGFSTAWLTFDEADSDLLVFIALLVNATRQQLHDEGQAILGFLQAVPNAEEKIPQLANLFINYLIPNKHTPLVVILDDYHHLTAASIHQFIAHLVDYMPPTLRLVIATRYDPPLPLARWRMRGQLAEIRQRALLFTTAESTIFLNQRHALALTKQEIDALQQQTEGWIAGLQLLTTVLAARPDNHERTAYIEHFGSTTRAVFDLLVEEVWGLQAPDIQAFLLQTSVLPELTPTNCRAVTQDDAAPQLLETVYRRNLFLRVIGSNTRQGPFRYHDLFHDFLQHKLQEEDAQAWHTLNHRAAQVASSDEQKLTHLTRAAAWEEVADLLQEMGQADTEQRFLRQLVIRSIEALPADVLQSRPWLHLFVAQYYSLRGQVEASLPWLTHAAAEFRAQGDEMGEIEILTARAMGSSMDIEDILAGFNQRIATAGSQFRPDHWVVYHGVNLVAALARCDWPTLTEHLQANLHAATHSDDPGVIGMAAYVTTPHMLFNDAGLTVPNKFAEALVAQADHSDWLLRISGQALLAFVRFFQARVDEADKAIKEAHRLLQEIGGLAYADDHVAWLMFTLLLMQRNYRAFDELFAAETTRWQTQKTSLDYLRGFRYMQGRAFWQRGRITDAQTALAHLTDSTIPSWDPIYDETCQWLLSGLIAEATGDTVRAAQELRQAATLHTSVRHTVMLNHPRLALASFHGRQQQWGEAMRELRAVIEEVKNRGMPGVILQEGESIVPVLEQAIQRGIERDYLTPLLAILQPDDSPQIIPLPNSDVYLTAREGEVLRLLATGVTNRAIADELTVTERTVKAHVTRILTKLNVTTRTEAVMKANQLGLL